jgi:dTDP-4-dehydrorhamnose reductase
MSSRSRVLIVGGDSQVGNYLVENIDDKEFEVTYTSRRAPKLGSDNIFFDLDGVNDIQITNQFDFAIICLGVTSVDKCETDSFKSHQLNVIATAKLIDKLIKLETFIVYLSSNLVFSGEKEFYTIDDVPNPRSNYGKFKVEVEKHLASHIKSHSSILRMTKILPVQSNRRFPWQLEILEGKEAQLFTNVFLAPVSMKEVGDSILAILRNSISGLFQISAPTEFSYFEFGTLWAIENHLDPALIVPALNLNPNLSKHNSLTSRLPIS